MPHSCFVCKARASPNARLRCCGKCRSTLYCSEACQQNDWKQHGHKKICTLLNVGWGAMQVRHPDHGENSTKEEEDFKETERSLDEAKM
jgi:hypothetical protein